MTILFSYFTLRQRDTNRTGTLETNTTFGLGQAHATEADAHAAARQEALSFGASRLGCTESEVTILGIEFDILNTKAA